MALKWAFDLLNHLIVKLALAYQRHFKMLFGPLK